MEGGDDKEGDETTVTLRRLMMTSVKLIGLADM